MARDLVAMIVTVEVDIDAWDATYGEYEAEDTLTYVQRLVETSQAVSWGAIKPDVSVRFRRQPIEGKH
jgi:hypothetical protein